MSIIDDYKQLQMIENIKKIKEMEICYKSNLKLCKKQASQINKLATCIEEIEKIVKNLKKDICNNCGWRNTDSCEPEEYTCGAYIEILEKIKEVRND